MLRLRTFTAGGLAAVLVLASAFQAQAEGPLDLVPDSASVIVKLKSPEETINSVGNFANKAQPGIGFMIQSQAPALGVLISNPTLGGVDLSKDWHVAVFPKKDTDPAVAFVIPATDAQAMKDAVGEPFKFATKGDWVAYSQDGDAMKLIEACASGAGKSISIDRRSAGMFNSANLAVHVNLNQIKEIFADELDKADEELARGLEQIQNAPGAPPNIDMKGVQAVLSTLGEGLLQAVRDSKSFTAGISVDDKALTIEELLSVDSDSATDKFLTSNEPGNLSLLEKLPQDHQMYFGVKGNMKGLIDFGLQVATDILGDDSDVGGKLKEVGAQLSSVEFGASAGAVQLTEGESGVLRSVSLTEAKPAAALRKLMQESGNLNFQQPGVTQEVDIKTEAESYGDLKADVITVKQHFDPAADPLGVAESITTMLYGEGGMVSRVVTKGDLVLQTQGGGRKDMEAALAATSQPRDSIADSPVLKARKGALDKVNFIGMIDIPNLAVRGLSLAIASGQLPIPIPGDAVKDIKIAPSYVVFSVGTEPGGLRMKTSVPAETLQGFATMSMTIQRAMQGAGGGF